MLAVIDFGSQYTHLIGRRIRQLNVYSEIFPPHVRVPDIKKAEAVILSGGPSSVYEENAPQNDELLDWLLTEDVPTLGICYGLHLIAHHFRGRVVKGDYREYGITEAVIEEDPLFQGLDKTQRVWMSHGDRVEELPPGFSPIASTKNCRYAAFRHKRMYAVQWHPEVHHTEHGIVMLSHFLDIARATRDWNMGDFAEQAVTTLKREVSGKAVIGLSGGVDSSVVAALVSKAIGKRLTCVLDRKSVV